jgi:hypothetical protein
MIRPLLLPVLLQSEMVPGDMSLEAAEMVANSLCRNDLSWTVESPLSPMHMHGF